jgi:hypothetical protein
VQPWTIDADADGVTIRLAPEHTSALDVEFRGSAVAVGAALFNARVAASAKGRLGPVTVADHAVGSPLSASIRFGEHTDVPLAGLYESMLRRVTNRRPGDRVSVPLDTIDALADAARDEGARLHLLTDRAQLDSAADLLGAADRTRYLTPLLHAEMFGELRWPGDPDPDAGIDVQTLELDDGEHAVLGILRRADVMAHLAQWNAGTALGDLTRSRVAAASALAVITVTGSQLSDYARGGSAAESVWIHAERHGLAVQPMSPVFLYARTGEELAKLSEQFSGELSGLTSQFRTLCGVDADEELVLIMRFTSADPPTVGSRRCRDRIRLSFRQH